MVVSFEEIFASMKLGVIVPELVHDLPEEVDESWLQSIESERQREKAFYDERLVLFFTAATSHPTSEEPSPSTPPLQLAQYLSRLQITLDAKYISTPPPIPSRSSSHNSGINLAPPPRPHSHRKGTAKSKSPLAIFPPHTPNPTPQTGESDRKYVANTEGTILESFVWGETAREEPQGRKFALVWSSKNNVWIAIYRLTVGVAFLRTSSPEPVLSLTVSATLREKPLAITPDRQALSDLLRSAGNIPDIDQQPAPALMNSSSKSLQDDELHGLQEINLLEGLSSGLSFENKTVEPLQFPSTRFASSFRQSTFSLSPLQPPAPLSAVQIPSTATPSGNRTTPILRMSYMKTLQTVSGFQIRMKSVFAPYVAIPGTTEDEDERREAGSEERTIVLSVELANGSTFSGPGSTGFNIEDIDVKVGGEGATANLISWGDQSHDKSKSIFPLIIGPAEQFNLLYAITFMRQSEVDEIADTLRQEANAERLRPAGPGDLQRQVSIVVRGRPFDFWTTKDKFLQSPQLLAYPTKTFKSRWNCILDLSSSGQTETFDTSADPPSSADALPAPATPFPVMTSTAAKHTDKAMVVSPGPSMAVIGGGKRHTFGGIMERLQRATPGPYRNSTPVFTGSITSENSTSSQPTSPPGNNSRFTPSLPSLVIKGHSRFSSTAAITNLPSPGLLPQPPGINGGPPPTPAYPAYPVDAAPPAVIFQSPISSNRNSLTAPSAIEPRRERGTTAMSPQTPGPRMFGSFFPDGLTLPEEPDDGDPIVVSVGLIPRTDLPNPDVIYTLDTFGIEIFVFNRSERTRRFEVSYPDKRRRRQHAVAGQEGDTVGNIVTEELGGRYAPGLLPLDDRIRIGPLRPHTCQSVRMQFLALRPGVQSIASLTFADVESGFTKNLKSVMDIVVYNEEDSMLQPTSSIANLSLLV